MFDPQPTYFDLAQEFAQMQEEDVEFYPFEIVEGGLVADRYDRFPPLVMPVGLGWRH